MNKVARIVGYVAIGFMAVNLAVVATFVVAEAKHKHDMKKNGK